MWSWVLKSQRGGSQPLESQRLKSQPIGSQRGESQRPNSQRPGVLGCVGLSIDHGVGCKFLPDLELVLDKCHIEIIYICN